MPAIATEISAWQPAPRSLPEGQMVFAIGDVHGYAAQLDALQALIGGIIQDSWDENDRRGQPRAAASVVWLGDYVDRGGAPLESLDLVAAGLGRPGIEEVRLLGNHDVYLRDAATGRDVTLARLLNWWRFGGAETLKCLAPEARIEAPEVLVAALGRSLGAARLAFLESLALQHRVGDYVFVHAGLDPARPLEAQREEDLLWIREPFLSATTWPHPVTVVHGHTPEGPEVRDHRICVDSGVYMTGRLSAVELRGGCLRFLAAQGEA